MSYQEFVEVAPYIVGGLAFLLTCNYFLIRYLEKKYPGNSKRHKSSLEKSLSN